MESVTEMKENDKDLDCISLDGFSEDDDEMTLAQLAKILKSKRGKEPRLSKHDKPRDRNKKTTKSNNKKDLKTTKKSNAVAILKKFGHNVNKVVRNSNATPFSSKNAYGYICAYCSETIPDSFSLRFHTSSRHRNDVLTFKNKSTRDDLGVKIDITDLECNICRHKFDRFASLKDHLSSDHSIQFFDIKDYVLEFKLTESIKMGCALCSSTYETYKMLLQHTNTHYQNHFCDICDYGFFNKVKLRSHKRLVHQRRAFRCTVCSKAFTSNKSRKRHEKSHGNQSADMTKCPQCPESFRNYYSRHRHMIKVHKLQKVSYYCDYCDRKFSFKNRLTAHIKTYHLMEKDVLCEVCGAAFYSVTRLRVHIARHRSQIYECFDCLKAFGRQQSLEDHYLRRHKDISYYDRVMDAAYEASLNDLSGVVSHSITLSKYHSIPHIIVENL